MKLRNLISAALLVGVGSTALPAAALVYTQYPSNLPSNCRVTMTSPLPLYPASVLARSSYALRSLRLECAVVSRAAS